MSKPVRLAREARAELHEGTGRSAPTFELSGVSGASAREREPPGTSREADRSRRPTNGWSLPIHACGPGREPWPMRTIWLR
jgi:hypothetical protein